ncbi:MAG: GAF domain-containing protein, partial [Bradyrhizobium sp.]
LLALAADGMIVPQAGVDEAGGGLDVTAVPPFPIDRGSASGVAILDGRTLNLADLTKVVEELPRMKQLGLRLGFHSGLWVPLRRAGEAIGILAIARRTTGAFTEQEVTLAETFADQAVIAIENVRLFNETKDALERQTATAEILKVISESPTNVQPVFDAIAQSAASVFRCSAAINSIDEDDRIHLKAVAGPHVTADRVEAWLKLYPIRLAGTIVGRAIQAQTLVELLDTEAEGVPETMKTLARAGGFRSVTVAPLMREGKGIGAIALTDFQFGFHLDDKQKALLQTFADQAVIAIQNARLFNETKEALERQTATAEILKVISRSPTEVRPVFYAICRSAAQLFGCRAGISIAEGGRVALKALARPDTPETSVEVLGIAIPAFEDAAVLDQWRNALEALLGRLRAGTSANWSLMRCVATREVVAISDTEAPEADEADREAGRSLGVRSITQVPLVRDGVGIGVIGLAFPEPGVVLNDKQRALVQTFADQAVIAIENVRLFNETREALERQTATAEILKVISSSPTNVQPVFDAIVNSGARLFEPCNAVILMRENELLHLRAYAGPSLTNIEESKALFPIPFDPKNIVAAEAMVERRIIAIPDTENLGDTRPLARSVARTGRYRSLTMVPLIREGQGIGTIALTHPEPGYSLNEKQLDLVRTFADQAVIAIENVRLFNETKEALERQTATAEILKVISGSPTDVQPVFDAIAASAARLFAPATATIIIRSDDKSHLVGSAGPLVSKSARDELAKIYPRRFDPELSVTALCIHEMREIRIADTESPGINPKMDAAIRATGHAGGHRSAVLFPLVNAGVGIGLLGLTHPKPGFALDDKQRALMKAFADQAVIAIENVRLFNETREALERQTATAEVLQVISSSVADTAPVFDKIIRSCE